MVTFIIIVFILVALLFLTMCIMNSRNWAVMLQEYYIREAKRLYGESRQWEHAWTQTLFRFIIIFSSLIIVIIVYALLFGPIEI